MNIRKSWKLQLLGTAFAVLGLAASQAFAANPAFLNIDVAIGGTKSVTVDEAGSSTYTVTWTPGQRQLNSQSTATVKNDSGGLSEKWALSTNAQSINTGDKGGSAVWSIVTSTAAADVGADQFALMAVFVSSNETTCPAYNAAPFSNGASSVTLVTDSLGTYGYGTEMSKYVKAGDSLAVPDRPHATEPLMYSYNAANGRGRRALCWAFIGPTSTADPDTQNIQITVTAQ